MSDWDKPKEDMVNEMLDRKILIKTQAKEIEKLRAALRPFAGMADYCEGDSDSESACVFVGDLRQARAALGEKE